MAPEEHGHDVPVFDTAFEAKFETLLHWRRDVRRFQTRPLAEGVLGSILAQADLAPSVGNSQPWRVVRVVSPGIRTAVLSCFERENAAALASYDDDQATLYARLKLAGLQEAPEQLAVFCDERAMQGHGLGRATMPEMLAYSVVGMIQTLWLAARIKGVGVGWVSILDPVFVHQALKVPDHWRLVGYLCIGYPEEEHDDPELERAGWQARTPMADRIFQR